MRLIAMAMSRKSKKKSADDVHVHVIVPRKVVAKIDAEVMRCMRKSPGSIVTRSDVVRRAIHRYIG